MRTALASLFSAAVACGGAAQKPADSPPEAKSETASESSASSGPDMPSAPGTGASDAPATPTPAAASKPAAAPEAPAPAAAYHPVPTVTGAIDGQPFTPKLARVVGHLQKDGRIQLVLGEATDCTGGGATLTMLVPWQDGYKADLGSLKRGTKKAPGEISFSRAGNKTLSATFKPSGTVTIVSAPMMQNATGKLKIDLQSGDYMLAGDLDIQVCVPPK